MAKIELMKIEDTFPLNNKQTQKLNKISIPNSCNLTVRIEKTHTKNRKI